MATLSIEKHDVVNDIFIIRWNDGEESYIPLQTMRDACPCAMCGEQAKKKAGNNIMLAARRIRTEASSQLMDVQIIGYYAVRLFWGDGHNTGIYRYELLRELGGAYE
ncbi:MAG: DUF971 domain-containing protein [Candidatus Marinimicrobia bacterium]|nr:DUF971 domain-containing protein [Candidatus Neomarinimicrobiota bacterium]